MNSLKFSCVSNSDNNLGLYFLSVKIWTASDNSCKDILFSETLKSFNLSGTVTPSGKVVHIRR